MRGNVVTMGLVYGEVARGTPVYQWDYGQVLTLEGAELPAAYEVHFANSRLGESVTVIGGGDGVAIPDALLTSGADVYVWVYLHQAEDDGETEYHGVIPVIERGRPTDQEPTPVQQDAITQAIAALNAAVESTGADALRAEGWAAGTQDGAPVERGSDYYQNNAAFYADLAGQAAAEAGYMFFYIDENGDLIYVRTANVEVDFALDDGDLYVEVG